MPKTFYTDIDIEELARRGTTSLVIDDDTVLTDLAHEKAHRLGIELVSGHGNPPCAPVRPYISKISRPEAVSTLVGPKSNPDLHRRIHDAVIARLGNQVDSTLVDKIIQRVLDRIALP
jgi:hypothetical protein